MSDAFGELREALSARPMDVDAVLDALAQVHNDQMLGAQAMVIRALAEEVKRRPIPTEDRLAPMKAETTYGVTNVTSGQAIRAGQMITRRVRDPEESQCCGLYQDPTCPGCPDRKVEE